jgi:hypothetical protein
MGMLAEVVRRDDDPAVMPSPVLAGRPDAASAVLALDCP